MLALRSASRALARSPGISTTNQRAMTVISTKSAEDYKKQVGFALCVVQMAPPHSLICDYNVSANVCVVVRRHNVIDPPVNP